MTGPPPEVGMAGLESEAAGKRDLRHVERPAHERMADLRFPQVDHPFAARGLVPDDRGRALVRGPVEFPEPHRQPVYHAPCQGLETERYPRLLTRRPIEGRG